MKRIGILLIAVWCCCSCQDFLNLVPKNKQVVYTLDDVKSSMSSFLLASGRGTAYNISFNGRRLYFPLQKDVTDAFTMYSDDIDMTRYFDYKWGTAMKSIYDECIDWKGVKISNRIWGYFYTSIGYLNEALKNMKNAPDGDRQLYEQLSGEARVFRAYYIFKLLQIFAPYNDNALGIPLNLDADVVSAGGRLKHSEVYQIIINELRDVLEYQAPALNKWNVMYDKDIVKAILAQVYLFKATSPAAESEDWSNAAKYSGELADKYSLEPDGATISSQFIPEPVVGWKKDNGYALLMMVAYNSNIAGYEFSPWGAEDEVQFPNPELVEMFDPADVRLTTYVNQQKINGSQQWYICKFNYYDYYKTFDESIALFRIAEMYLINAEANARMNQIEAATQRLVKFRQSRVPEYTTFSGNLLDEILKERRKEFCFESDFRFLDMKRLGISASRQGIDPTDGSIKTYTLDAEDYRFALPIPVDLELSYNNNISQNPGWNVLK